MAKVEDCPGFETFGADVKAAREARRSKFPMFKVILYCIFFKLLIKLFTHGKSPPVSVSIIRIFLKLAMFNLYYLYSNTNVYMTGSISKVEKGSLTVNEVPSTLT